MVRSDVEGPKVRVTLLVGLHGSRMIESCFLWEDSLDQKLQTSTRTPPMLQDEGNSAARTHSCIFVHAYMWTVLVMRADDPRYTTWTEVGNRITLKPIVCPA